MKTASLLHCCYEMHISDSTVRFAELGSKRVGTLESTSVSMPSMANGFRLCSFCSYCRAQKLSEGFDRMTQIYEPRSNINAIHVGFFHPKADFIPRKILSYLTATVDQAFQPDAPPKSKLSNVDGDALHPKAVSCLARSRRNTVVCC